MPEHDQSSALPCAFKRGRWYRRIAWTAVLATAAGTPAAALGQFNLDPKTENPVFVDESPVVAEGLSRAREHVAAGNIEQAARTLAKLLDERADTLLAGETDPMLFGPVRTRVHALLLSNKALLDRYREVVGTSTRQMLDAGRIDDVQRSRLMTNDGLTATLRLARSRILQGRFESGTMLLLELRGHPDLAARAKDVKDVLTLAGRYETRAGARRALASIVDGAELPPAEPAAASVRVPSFGEGSTSTVVDDVVNQPTGTAEFGDTSASVQPPRFTPEEQSLDQLPPFAREMRCWPAVGDNGIYLSDGAMVCGFDRVSMRRLWSVDAATLLNLPPGDPDRKDGGTRRPMANSWEEVVQPTLTLGSSLVVAVVGREYDGAQNVEGEERLVAFDATNGAVRYSVSIRGLDEQLSDAFERGPLVTDGRVVVVNMLKRQNQRRLLANILVGVDAETGAKLWTRTVGSAGVLPFSRTQLLTDNLTASEGVVYRYDRLGAVGAYSIADGRPLWVRRLTAKVMLEAPTYQQPWLVHHPQLTREGLIVLSPDRDEMQVIDAETGALKAHRNAGDLLAPEYLVTTPTHLVAVGKTRIATLPLGELAAGTPRVSPQIGSGSGGIRGRVTTAANTVVVPTTAGVVVLDPGDPTRAGRTLALDEPGSPLALPEGLLVVDDARAHMYCAWRVAAEHLRSQIAASPTDPAPAVELLRLAERVGKGEEMLPAADSALAALKASPAPQADALETAVQRSMIVATLLRAAERSTDVRVEQAGAKLDAAGIDGALQRAKEAAVSPSDKVAVLLAAGGVSESRSEWSAAAASYQAIVADEALSAAPGPGSAGGSTALATAVERLSRVVKQGGRGAYAEFDRALNVAASALKPGAQAEELEKVALSYPLAQHGPELWLRAADAYGTTQTPQAIRAASRALERGVQTAERTGDSDPVTVGELNGRLVQSLIDRGLLAAAADALARAQRRFPTVTLQVGGKPMEASAVRGSILQELAAARRWPRIGTPRSDRAPQLIDGWVLMEPLIHPSGASGSAGGAPFVVLHKGDERRTQVALFGLKPGQLAGEAAEDAPTPLTELWFSQMGTDTWTLVRTDRRGALFFVGELNGGRLLRVDAESSKVAWQTEPFGAMFPTDPPAKFVGTLEPVQNKVLIRERLLSGMEPRQSEIILAADDRTICMVERAGRCAAVDADTGQVLWTTRLPLMRISDATVSGGQLVAIGEFPQPQADSKVDRLALFDARTGARSAVNASPIPGVRYIRTTSRGDLILGASGAVAAVNAVDLETAKASWTLTGHPAASAWEAWLLDDRLFLMSDTRTLWEVSSLSGAAPGRPIDVQGRLDARTPVTVWQTADGTVVFATGRGMALIDGKGALRAADAVNAAEGSVAPVVAEGCALLLAPPGARSGGGGIGGVGMGGDSGVWNLYRLETAGAQLLSSTPIVFAAPPLRMAAIDGRVVISTGSGSVVIDAPVAAKDADKSRGP